jgi:hypothetical protein
MLVRLLFKALAAVVVVVVSISVAQFPELGPAAALSLLVSVAPVAVVVLVVM